MPSPITVNPVKRIFAGIKSCSQAAESRRNRVSQEPHSKSATGKRLVLALVFAVLGSGLLIETAEAQLGNLLPDSDGGPLVLSQPPRELRRAITKSETAVKERRYSDAIELLQEILNNKDTQDYLLPRGGGKTWDSLKRRAQRIVSTMPKAGREAYELEVGSDARRLLEEALANNDLASLAEVKRRYFHTSHGYTATMLLARFELDRGRPLAAAGQLRHLIDTPAALVEFQSEIPLLLSICYEQAGRPTDVRRVVESHSDLLAGAAVVVSGEKVRLPASANEIVAWIQKAVGNGGRLQVNNGKEWHLLRGGPDRNAESTGGMPMTRQEWEVPMALWESDVTRLNALQEQILDLSNSAEAAIPIPQPIAVGDWLLVRTVRMMFGIDLETGKRIWPYPEEEESREEPDLAASPNTGNLLQTRVTTRSPNADLKQFLFKDAIYTQISSDGERAFLLLPAETIQKNRLSIRNGRMQMRPSNNQLIALDIKREGMTLWTAGGPTGYDESLAEAFFLGSPLPIDNRLYVIAQINEDIQLLCLDSATGARLWSQQLAQVENNSPAFDATRRQAGATPSYSNGVLVCPTSVGAIVAVEPASRTLLWAHTYEELEARPFNRNRRSYVRTTPPATEFRKWSDAAPVISNNYVVFTPTESSKLLCLDLLTGEPYWPTKNRDKMVYLAGIKDDTLLCVQTNGLRAINLQDNGNRKWPDIMLEEGEAPTGRGFMNEGFYYFPTSASQVVKVDMERGEIVERQDTDRVLGNLICHRDYMVSQYVDGIYAYPLEARQRARLKKLIDARSEDPDVLHDYAQLLFEDGKTEAAIETMRRALGTSKSDDRREYQVALAEMLLGTMRDDFSRFADLGPQFNSLDPPQELRLEFAKSRMKGQIESGDIASALDAYVSAVELSTAIDASNVNDGEARPKPVADSSAWRVSNNVSLAMEFRSMLGIDATAVGKIVREQLQRAIEAPDTEALSLWSDILNTNANQLYATELSKASVVEYQLDPLDRTSADQLIELADLAALSLAKKLRKDSPLAAGIALANIINRQTSPDANSNSGTSVDENPASRMEAAVMQAEILSELRQYQAAAKQYDAIAEEFTSLKLGGKTGTELRAEFMATMAVRNVDLRIPQVPDGEVKVTRINEPQNRSTSSLRYRAVNLRSFTNPRLANHEFFVDFQTETLILNDGFGVPVDSWSLGPRNLRPARSNQLPHAHESNGVLVLALPYEIIAIDMFSDDENDAVLWRMDVPATSQTASNYNFQGLGVIDRKTPVPFSYLGSVTHAEVCFLRGPDLECRDLLTGKLRWVQRSQSTRPGTVVFGDQHFTCSNKQKTITTTGLANIFETATGRPLATGTMPGRHSLLATSGRFAVQFFGQVSSGNDFAVGAIDPATGNEIWKFEAEKQSQVCFVGHDELALFEPSGEFHVIRMSDGEILLEGSALPEKKLIGIVVKKTRDHYILATKNRPPKVKPRPASYLPRTQLYGKIYGYDRKTGKAQWDEVNVDNFDMMILPNELPFIFFAKKISVKQSIGQKETTKFAVLDTRTGRFVVHEELPATESFTQSTFDPVLKELSLGTQRTAIKIRPTDKPRSKPDPKIPRNLDDSTAQAANPSKLRPGVPNRPGVPILQGINR